MTDRPNIVRATDEHMAESPIPGAVGMSHRSTTDQPSSPHAHKFRAATATLIGVALGALAVSLVVLAHGRGQTPAGDWSSWTPPDSGTLGASEIADHLAPFYRISATDQLDVVTVINLSNPNAAATTGATSGLQVAIQTDPKSSQVSLLSGTTIAFNLCGIGTSNCAIGTGTPSLNRLLLLRREALELALYTFKYIGGTDNVVAVLPPGHTTQTSTLTPKPPAANSRPSSTKKVDIAVLFVKDQLKPWLNQPLNATLQPFPPAVPQLTAWHNTLEAGLVDQLTSRSLFSERLVQPQDGSSLMVLNSLPPQ